MGSFPKDLGNCSFIRCPGNTVNVLCEQYLGDFSKLLNKHALEVTRTFTKQAAALLSDCYQLAKAIRQQLERIWHKDKSANNGARLCRQIARCNSLVNKDKGNYFRNLEKIRENANDSKKLYGRSYALHCTQVLKQYSLFMNLRKVLLTCLPLFSGQK